MTTTARANEVKESCDSYSSIELRLTHCLENIFAYETASLMAVKTSRGMEREIKTIRS